MGYVPANLLADFAAEATPVAARYLANEIPQGILVAAAEGFATTYGLSPGTVSSLVAAAIALAGHASTGVRPVGPKMRGTNMSGLKRPTEKSSASASSTVRKTGRREDRVSSALDIVERPLRLGGGGNGPGPKSVWTSLKQMVEGKRVLRNTFSFKIRSTLDKRGLMAIPLRHEADLAMDYDGWAVGSQHLRDVAADPAGFPAYKTMVLEPKQRVYDTVYPAHTADNVVVPRLNLPTLEQTSWDLNALKLIPSDKLMDRYDADGGHDMSLVVPIHQLGGSAIPWATDATTPNVYPNGLPGARDSFARRQDAAVGSSLPFDGFSTVMPQFKTQLGGGSLKMRCCNQGTNQCVVEFVLVKVVNSLSVGIVDGDTTATKLHGGFGSNMTKAWDLLFNSVGYEYAKKVTASPSYAMGDATPTPVQLRNDVLSNPYKEFLPSSCFKAKWPMADNEPVTNSELGGGLTRSKQNEAGYNFSGGVKTSQMPKDGVYDPVVDQFHHFGGIGQKTPYRVVTRGHCTIGGAAERTVTIPLPSSNYNASSIQSMATSTTSGLLIDSVKPCLLSDESYIVFMSVNGSMQDMIETNQVDSNNITVIGKAYTSAVVDCHCQYSETVYPSHCDYSLLSPEKFNLGVARGPQVVSETAYAGRVMPMGHAVPVVQDGVVRTGATNRGAAN